MGNDNEFAEHCEGYGMSTVKELEERAVQNARRDLVAEHGEHTCRRFDLCAACDYEFSPEGKAELAALEARVRATYHNRKEQKDG